jgi:hypothetical protein
VPYLVAALVAGALGAIEQYNRLQTRLTRGDYAWAFWAMRIVLEMAIGFAAMAIAIAAKPSLEHDLLAWIAAGAAGPIAVRTRIIDIGVGSTARPVGLATAYEPVRDWIAARIDDIGAAAQSKWITEELLPVLAKEGKPPKEVGDRLVRWCEGSERFSKVAVGDQRAFVRKTLGSKDSDDIKRELLVLKAIELKAFRVLRDLRKTCGDTSPKP